MNLYPAIDLRGGTVVRLKEGDPARMTLYSQEPVETAQRWLNAGACWLHVVNLDAAFGENDDANLKALKAILSLGANVQFGGGKRSIDAVARAIDLGVKRVVLGTVAIESPQIVAQALARFGSERIAVGIDARDGFVRVRGWQQDSGVSSVTLAMQMRALGLRTMIFTDISRDGLGSGLNITATKTLANLSQLEVIASGGVNSLEDVKAAKDAGLAGCIIGRALYDDKIDLAEALKISDDGNF